jgi:hypothetical protein
VVRHNHTIIEKEVPVTLHRLNGCYRGSDYVGYGSCRPSLRVRG